MKKIVKYLILSSLMFSFFTVLSQNTFNYGTKIITQNKLLNRSNLKKNVFKENINLPINKKNLTNFYIKLRNSKKHSSSVPFIRLGINAGLLMTDFRLKVDDVPPNKYLIQMETELDFSPTIGVYSDINLNKGMDLSYFHISLFYTSFYQSFENENVNINIGLKHLKLLTALKFRFDYKIDFIPFVIVGVSNGLAFDIVNENPQNYMYDKKALKNIVKFEQGIYLGTGINYKKFNFNIQVERNFGFTHLATVKTNVFRYFFTIGYDLFLS